MAIVENKELTAAKLNQRTLIAAARLEKVMADMEYIAMMTDIDLDEEEGNDEPEV